MNVYDHGEQISHYIWIVPFFKYVDRILKDLDVIQLLQMSIARILRIHMELCKIPVMWVTEYQFQLILFH